jgi:integrase
MREEPYHHTVTRYTGPDGRRCKSTDQGAVKTTEETATYYGELPALDGGKPERVNLGTADLGAAWQVLREKRKARLRELEGVADPVLGAARKPLVEHLDEWRETVIAAGTSEKHADLMRQRLATLAQTAEWTRLGDLTPESVVKALAKIQEERTVNMVAGRVGRGNQTRNHYRSHLRQFCRWLRANKRLDADVMAGVGRVNVEIDVRRRRRCPTDQEIAALFTHLESGNARPRVGMTGPQRALGYKVSMATGFRGREIRRIIWEGIDLVAAAISVGAAYSKHRRCDTQHIPAWLVAELTIWQNAGGGLWSGFHERWPGRQLQADLLAAGVPPETQGLEGPEFFDFHSLRVWYCTALGNQPGISPKTLMELCRHSTPTLSLQVYAKARRKDVAEAVEKIPRPGQTG